MHTLENDKVRMMFNDDGGLVGLERPGKVAVPIDPDKVTAPFDLELRDGEGNVAKLAPQSRPDMRLEEEEGDTKLILAWQLSHNGDSLKAVATVRLPKDSQVSAWTMQVENGTPHAIWRVVFPRISGLTSFEDQDGPDWLAVPYHGGEAIPDPVPFVVGEGRRTDARAAALFGLRDREGQAGDITFSYPGMWTMQFLAYGHPRTGGVYFAAHDPAALYKNFGFHKDRITGDTVFLAMEQYPADRTAAGGDFASYFDTAVGCYAGDWWGASALYREWATKQEWCQNGPARENATIPQWLKDNSFWYWNHKERAKGAPFYLYPAIKYLKERFECETAGFHWYEYTGMMHDNLFTYPHMYPHDPDCKKIITEAVRDFHRLNVRCIPYINSRLWNPGTISYEELDGDAQIALDEHGEAAHPWASGAVGITACPTSEPYHEIIRKTNHDLMVDIGMDGSYLDQITCCFAVPCFNKDHDHPPGGHDHWYRGYRELCRKVRADMREIKDESIITSEGVIECYQDLFDADLRYADIRPQAAICKPAGLHIPLFDSVYHDYHVTYGSDLLMKMDLPQFAYTTALNLAFGIQIGVSGFFPGDESKRDFPVKLDFLEKAVRAHRAARSWLNLGEWKPPAAVECEQADITFSGDASGLRMTPAIQSGCFLLDGELCIVLVNHTDRPQHGTVRMDLADYGLASGPYKLDMVYPEAQTLEQNLDESVEYAADFDALSVRVLAVRR